MLAFRVLSSQFQGNKQMIDAGILQIKWGKLQKCSYYFYRKRHSPSVNLRPH
ncbi:hypothetical protein C7431_104257 [Pantoea allii]|uniref:Uncharacterized protein n=1 Tax=Pantoea allii TaxID=574096 RepID=A0A2V2BKK6_9GAMM|nr:hypothetical protein C7431_104257 [Pantoea allii]TWD42934.1 hypothetical protein FBY13_103349 [Pantoea sp. SJZ147]